MKLRTDAVTRMQKDRGGMRFFSEVNFSSNVHTAAYANTQIIRLLLQRLTRASSSVIKEWRLWPHHILLACADCARAGR